MWWIDLLLYYFDFKDLVKCSAALFLIMVFVSLIQYQTMLRSREKLRWQLKTKRNLDKEINNRSIDVESANDIITYPSYGIEKDEASDAALAILDQEKWEHRQSASIGWEANTLFVIGILFLYLTTILIRLIGLVAYVFIEQVDFSRPDQIYLLLLFILLRPLLLALAYYYARMVDRRSLMEKYPQRAALHLQKPEGVHFITLARSEQDYYKIQWLIDSIREFGGDLINSPITVYETKPHIKPFDDFKGDEIYQEKLTIPDALQGYPNAGQVFACYHAEVMAANRFGTLIWVSPEYLVFKTPELLDLGTGFDIALRPVYEKREGILKSEPLNDYWQNIYKAVGVEDIEETVIPFTEQKQEKQKRIRACFNVHAFAVNPAKGIFKLWYECFGKLIADVEFQKVISPKQKEFLHQALLSTLFAVKIIPDRIRILPPKYSYPFHLHSKVPNILKIQNLDDLVSIAFEGEKFDPYVNPEINISRSLRDWLVAESD
ncbi:MAG: hypothetical protein ISR58_09405 [Anaerolineales bacterium]|nr:hypothetical protein [Chloroflexota bacterium]MBL6981392.1 hypothetical protein [Anaerolineales bacterium]